MRSLVKQMVERSVLWSGAARVQRKRHAGDVLVLAYHNVVPHGEVPFGDPSLHLPQAHFAAQLDALLSTHEVVPLESVLDGDTRAHRKPRIVITFDDAYRGTLTAGIPELEKRGLPATVFVAPHFVGDAPFWWDVFAGRLGLPDGFREHALGALRGEDARVREWGQAAGFRAGEPPAHARCGSEDDIRSALRSPGITVGSHTWSHPNLAVLDARELADELGRPLPWLRERFERAVPWLAYPYGLASETVHVAARAAGYRGALRVDGGWIAQGSPNLLDLPRLDVSSGLSPEGFRIRISGLFC
jgi:peptidoglycan/xylan/chitin deacetylase (PgdA/CDA1 family)